jgi:hypothetical protein
MPIRSDSAAADRRHPGQFAPRVGDGMGRHNRDPFLVQQVGNLDQPLVIVTDRLVLRPVEEQPPPDQLDPIEVCTNADALAHRSPPCLLGYCMVIKLASPPMMARQRPLPWGAAF